MPYRTPKPKAGLTSLKGGKGERTNSRDEGPLRGIGEGCEACTRSELAGLRNGGGINWGCCRQWFARGSEDGGSAGAGAVHIDISEMVIINKGGHKRTRWLWWK